jgi:hypothetical protein
VDDLVEADAAEQLVKSGAVEEVAADKLKRVGKGLEVAQVALFEARVVTSVKLIERPDGVAGTKKPLANMRADEAGATRNQKIHVATLPEGKAGCRGAGPLQAGD